MGSSAGSIFVDLLLRDSNYQKGLGKNASATEKFARQATTSLKAVGTGLAAFFTIDAFASITKSSIEAASHLQDLSERLGLSTTDLQRYSAAANLAGVDSDTLETALTKLQTNIANGTLGYKNANDAIRDLADRIQNAKSQTEAASIANEAFGAKLGAKMIPVLKDGQKGLKALGDEAQRLGAVISSDTIEATDKFGDTLDFLAKVVKGNFQQGFLSGFVGDAGEIKKVFTDKDFIEGIKELGAGLAEVLKNLVDLVKYVSQHKDEFALIAKVIAGGAVGGKIGGGRGAIIGAIGTAAYSAIPEIGDKHIDAAHMISADDLARLKGAAAAEKGIAVAADQDTTATIKRVATKAQLNAALEQQKKDQEALAKTYEDMQPFLDGLDDATRDYTKRIDELDTLLQHGIITQDEYSKGVAAVGVAFDKAKDKGNGFAFDLEAASKRAAENIQDALADFLFDPFADGLQGMLKGWVDTLRKMAAQAAAAKIGGELFGKDGTSGPLGSIFSGLGKSAQGSSDQLGSWLSKSAGSVGDWFSGFFADGGYIPPGGWGIAGEQGAEPIFGGRTGVTVHPAGGSGQTINIDARGADAGVEQRIMRALQYFAGPGVTEGRVGDARTRGAL